MYGDALIGIWNHWLLLVNQFDCIGKDQFLLKDKNGTMELVFCLDVAVRNTKQMCCNESTNKEEDKNDLS